MSLKVLVVDDSPLVRETVEGLLAGHPQFEVVGSARGGYESIQMARELRPDLVLMDLRMPDCDGFLATRLIKKERPATRVVVLSASGDPQDLFAAIGAGAQGYLPKSLPPSDWLRVLEGLMAEDRGVDRGTAQRILAEFQEVGQSADTLAELTQREREVLELVGSGYINREIAERLFLSENTVKNHIKRILEKLHMRNRVELAALAGRRLR